MPMGVRAERKRLPFTRSLANGVKMVAVDETLADDTRGQTRADDARLRRDIAPELGARDATSDEGTGYSRSAERRSPKSSVARDEMIRSIKWSGGRIELDLTMAPRRSRRAKASRSEGASGAAERSRARQRGGKQWPSGPGLAQII